MKEKEKQKKAQSGEREVEKQDTLGACTPEDGGHPALGWAGWSSRKCDRASSSSWETQQATLHFKTTWAL